MENVGGFAYKTSTSLPFEEAISKVTELLASEGFGVLTEIDVKATMKKKLDVEHKPYKILGACNPPFAHKALETEELIGVLLPCNVVVWDDGDKRTVAAMDPHVMAKVMDNPAVHELADQVGKHLESVLEQVSKL